MRRLTPPLSDADVAGLQAGDRILLCGPLLAARDAAHERFAEALARGEALPVEVAGQVLYYVGPTPARPGEVIGSAGPTTASRMDRFTPALLALGLKGTIGKGGRSPEVVEAMRRYRAVYFGAVGGGGRAALPADPGGGGLGLRGSGPGGGPAPGGGGLPGCRGE